MQKMAPYIYYIYSHQAYSHHEEFRGYKVNTGLLKKSKPSDPQTKSTIKAEWAVELGKMMEQRNQSQPNPGL